MSTGKLGEICSECGKPIRPIHNPEDPSVFIGDEHGDWILVNGKYLTPKEVEALESEVKRLTEQKEMVIRQRDEHKTLRFEAELRLAKAQELIKRWRTQFPNKAWGNTLKACAAELEEALGCAGELTHGEVKTFVEEYERNLKELAEIDDDGGEGEKK